MPMPKFLLYTNNPDVLARYPDFAQYHAGDVREVFTAVRNAVHMGARILSHPLSGSIKPNESPYKSVAVSGDTGALDVQSLTMIEDALNVLEKLAVRPGALPESVLADFRLIDLDLINSAVDGLVQ